MHKDSAEGLRRNKKMETVFWVYWITKKGNWVGKGGVIADFSSLEEAVDSLKGNLRVLKEKGYDILSAYVMETEKGNTRNILGIPFYLYFDSTVFDCDIDNMTAEDPYGTYHVVRMQAK